MGYTPVGMSSFNHHCDHNYSTYPHPELYHITYPIPHKYHLSHLIRHRPIHKYLLIIGRSSMAVPHLV